MATRAQLQTQVDNLTRAYNADVSRGRTIDDDTNALWVRALAKWNRRRDQALTEDERAGWDNALTWFAQMFRSCGVGIQMTDAVGASGGATNPTIDYLIDLNKQLADVARDVRARVNGLNLGAKDLFNGGTVDQHLADADTMLKDIGEVVQALPWIHRDGTWVEATATDYKRLQDVMHKQADLYEQIATLTADTNLIGMARGVVAGTLRDLSRFAAKFRPPELPEILDEVPGIGWWLLGAGILAFVGLSSKKATRGTA